MTKIIGLSGGTGFCGKGIISKSLIKKLKIVSYQRRYEPDKPYTIKEFRLETVSTMEASLFRGIETFVHTAALVHKKNQNVSKYRSLNYHATKELFHKCIEAGVKKFIFFSTVGVYGLTSSTDSIRLDSTIDPKSAYAQSKLDAENYLMEHSPFYDIEVLILRFPLIYGPGAPGNFGFLTNVSRWPIPLPFKNVKNRRSMISIDNVGNLITDIVSRKIKWTGVQLITEPEPFSTESIILCQRENGKKPVMLFSMPKLLMKMMFSLAGRKTMYHQLYEDLVFESSQPLQSCID